MMQNSGNKERHIDSATMVVVDDFWATHWKYLTTFLQNCQNALIHKFQFHFNL